MQSLEFRYVDKTSWGDGAWQSEFDKRQWTDIETGLPCLIVRGPSGALCGYVGVSEGHPWFGRDYSGYESDAPDVPTDYEASPESQTEVHGGLTFSRFCAEGDPDHGICHRPDPGEPNRVWWFGFDCAHAGDYTPGSEARLRESLSPARYAEHEHFLGLGRPTGWGGIIEYRDVGYVTAECRRLASQLISYQVDARPTATPPKSSQSRETEGAGR